jgi:nucleolar protein 9
MAYYKNQELLEGAHKPKSPDPETITYLCQIEGLLDSHAAKMNKNQQASNGQQKNDSDENMEEDDSDDEEQLDLLVNNVHEEISGQQAGLSIDKSASVILEKLLTLSTPAQLRQFGASLRGYFLFLSSHRFGSHVLQKFMTLAPTVVSWDQHVLSASQKKTEEGEKKEGTDGPPITMEAILIDLCDEVGDKWIQLGKDLCGTHVMRSLLHSLTGRISVANNKTGSYTGKKKKKKKSGSKGKGRKKKGVAEYDEKYFNNSSNAIPEKTHEIPSSWSETLSNIIQSVSAKPAKDLYDMTFDTNASPILQLLMTLGSDKEDETDSLIRRILDWDELVAYEQRCAEKKQQSHIDGTELEQFRSWVDDMIRDTCSSHVLEVILQSSSDELFADLLDRIFSAHIAKYAKLPICNYVIQQLITCVRSSEQLERVSSIYCLLVNIFLMVYTPLSLFSSSFHL